MDRPAPEDRRPVETVAPTCRGLFELLNLLHTEWVRVSNHVVPRLIPLLVQSPDQVHHFRRVATGSQDDHHFCRVISALGLR